MPRHVVPQAVSSWTVEALGSDTWEFRDPGGRPRARVRLARRDTRRGPGGVPVPRPRRHVPVTLPDGSTATLRNGARRFGSRRGRTRGLLDLAGRRYVFSHRTAHRARVERDGRWLVTSRRDGPGSAPWPEVVAHEVLDPTDEVAVALFCRVLRPGRPSVLGRFWDVLDVLGTGTA